MKSYGNGELIHPEIEILLWAIRVDGRGEDRIRKLLGSEVNWSKLLQEAQSQRIIPLLHDRLINLPENCISTEMNLELLDLYQMNIYQSFMHVRQLLWIIQILSDHGVQAIPFKGVALSQQAHGTPVLRQCGDIDILIQYDQLPQLICAFHEVGLYPEIPFLKRYAFHYRIKRSISFHSQKYLAIDVHWGTFDIFTGFPAAKLFFQNTRTIKLLESKISTFSLEDTLILLSVHGTKHFWQNIQWIADIIHLIQKNPDLDISLALSKAEKLRCKRILSISLHMAHRLGGIDYPNIVQSALDEDPESLKIALGLIKYLQHNETPDIRERMFILIRSREHWVDAIGSALFVLFTLTPPVGCRIRLPRPLRPLYIFA